jgi:hypothetical protein
VRLAARKGVRLDTVLRRYLAGYTLFGDFLIEETEAAPCAEAPRSSRCEPRLQPSSDSLTRSSTRTRANLGALMRWLTERRHTYCLRVSAIPSGEWPTPRQDTR